ncbi:MAG: hypothetical protein NVS3B25_15340 [Hymenobacter sp.]
MPLLLVLALWLPMGVTPPVLPPATVLQAQPRPFSGRVLTPEQEPLSGATVLVKGTGTAVSTNADGSFLLPLPAGPHTLIIDYPAYRTVVIPVARPDSVLVIVLHATGPPVSRRRK